MHPAALAVADLLEQVEERHARRSGPGGQHRIKTQTAVILRHRPTGIGAEATERRSQAENRQVAVRRLRMRLAIEHRTPGAAPAASPRWMARVRAGHLVVAVGHEDYPALIAEALDALHANGFDMRGTAAGLGVTATQLLKLFKKDSTAWTALGSLRADRGLPPLM
jgi:hypothetical protein